MKTLKQNEIKNTIINIDDISNFSDITNNESVLVYGSVHKIKRIGQLTFINIRTHKYIIQCVHETSKCNDNIDQLSNEDCVKITGAFIEEKKSNLGFEIHVDKIKILSTSKKELPVEISSNYQQRNGKKISFKFTLCWNQ